MPEVPKVDIREIMNDVRARFLSDQAQKGTFTGMGATTIYHKPVTPEGITPSDAIQPHFVSEVIQIEDRSGKKPRKRNPQELKQRMIDHCPDQPSCFECERPKCIFEDPPKRPNGPITREESDIIRKMISSRYPRWFIEASFARIDPKILNNHIREFKSK